MSIINSYRTLREYRNDPIAFIEKMHKLHGHRIHLKIFGKAIYIISKPEDVLHVLKENHSAYTKGRTTRMLKTFLGNGLITNEGQSWSKQHKLLRPVMNLKSVHKLAPQITATVEAFLPELAKAEQTNALREMNRLTWRIILSSLFSLEVTPAIEDWLEDILELMQIITRKTRSSVLVPFWVPTPAHRKLRRIIRKFDEKVFALISERRNGDKKDDLLQLLIDAKEDGATDMTDREIRDEVMTFMMAGHETITNSMTWTLKELAEHPEYKERLLIEARDFIQTKDYERLSSAPWLGAVIDEVLRLWPPIWVFMRQSEKEDRIGHFVIPKKANVVLAPYLSHRAYDLWEKPRSFFPERFLPQNKSKIKSGAFYPFGLGPRACIGSYFAGMEARIILALIIHHFDWELVKKEKQKLDPGISLRPVNNIMMKFRSRD